MTQFRTPPELPLYTGMAIGTPDGSGNPFEAVPMPAVTVPVIPAHTVAAVPALDRITVHGPGGMLHRSADAVPAWACPDVITAGS